MVGCDTLEARCKIYLGKHFYKLLMGPIYNPVILQEMQLWVPTEGMCFRESCLFFATYTNNSLVARDLGLLNCSLFPSLFFCFPAVFVILP